MSEDTQKNAWNEHKNLLPLLSKKDHNNFQLSLQHFYYFWNSQIAIQY